MPEFLFCCGAAPVVLGLLYYVGFPLLVWSQQRMSADPDLKPVNLRRMPPADADFLEDQADALARLGFTEPVMVKVVGAVVDVTNYLIMMVNRQTGDKAMVTIIIADNVDDLQTNYVEFSTRFTTGEVFGTLNTSELNSFPPGPQTVRTQVPTVRDAAELFALHGYVIDKHNPPGRPVIYKPGAALEYLTEVAFRQSFDEQVGTGLLFFDDRYEVYRPTLTGAFRMAWGLQQPFKLFRQAALRRRARAILAEFDRARG